MLLQDAETLVKKFSKVLEDNFNEGTFSVDIKEEFVLYSRESTVEIRMYTMTDAVFRMLSIHRNNFGLSIQIHGDEFGVMAKVF